MKTLATLLLCSIPVIMMAQSKKELKDAGVISRTETTSKTEKGSTSTFKESFEKYDGNGNRIEVIEYKSNGDILNFQQFEYNANGKVTKEKKINPLNSQPKITIEYIYGADDKLIKELHYDSKNVVTKTVEITYENGLKKEKKITNNLGKVIEAKTYVYEKK